MNCEDCPYMVFDDLDNIMRCYQKECQFEEKEEGSSTES